jgi:hypothetical protein
MRELMTHHAAARFFATRANRASAPIKPLFGVRAMAHRVLANAPEGETKRIVAALAEQHANSPRAEAVIASLSNEVHGR